MRRFYSICEAYTQVELLKNYLVVKPHEKPELLSLTLLVYFDWQRRIKKLSKVLLQLREHVKFMAEAAEDAMEEKVQAKRVAAAKAGPPARRSTVSSSMSNLGACRRRDQRTRSHVCRLYEVICVSNVKSVRVEHRRE